MSLSHDKNSSCFDHKFTVTIKQPLGNHLHNQSTTKQSPAASTSVTLTTHLQVGRGSDVTSPFAGGWSKPALSDLLEITQKPENAATRNESSVSSPRLSVPPMLTWERVPPHLLQALKSRAGGWKH